jgi:hypothetical protein
MKGFIGIDNYDPTTNEYFGLYQRNVKKKIYSMSKEQIKERYIDYAIFYISYHGVDNGTFLDEPMEGWEQGITFPKFLTREENCTPVVLWIEEVNSPWETEQPNVQNDGLFRVLYNDADDTYYHAFFKTKEEALECFNFWINIDFAYVGSGKNVGIYDLLTMFKFWAW